MKYKKTGIILVIISALLILAVLYYGFQGKEESSFRVDNILIKSVVKTGESLTNELTIRTEKPETFHAQIKGLGGFVSFEDRDFFVDGKKTLKINFDAGINNEGVYTGSLIIEGESDKKEIPIILEIQSKNLLYATNLDMAVDYKELTKKDEFSAGIRLFNLNDTKTHNIEVSYKIKNTKSESVFSEKENIAVGTEALFTKTISLPEDINLGTYVFIVETRYSDSVSTSSYLFSIVDKEKKTSGNQDWLVNIFSIAVIVFLLGVIILIIYMISDRNKIFAELERMHDKDLELSISKIDKREKKYLNKIKNAEQKQKIAGRFSELRARTRERIKQIRKEHELEIKKLKKQKKENKINAKLREWKKQGYNVNELKIELKAHEKGVDKQIEAWAKQGYDTSALK